MRIGPALSVLLPLAIFLGLGIGKFLPAIGEKLGALIDPLVLALLALIFFEVRFAPLRRASERFGFVSMVWATNFILIPVLGWGLASLFFEHQSSLYAGLFLYFLFPCTDWFLAFTRNARGDIALGSVLIPINLVSQLLLFPLYLSIFLGSQTNLDFSGIWETFGQRFLFPFVAAVFLRFLLPKVLSAKYFEPFPKLADSLIPWVLSLLVFCIFACHMTQIINNPSILPVVLIAVSLFFFLTWILSEIFVRVFNLSRPQHVLFSMTTTARNSPLMLGLATLALPEQPLVYAVLIIGMLVEFPHLTILSHLLLRKGNRVTNMEVIT